MVFWMLAREVKILRGELERDEDEWKDVKVDLFYYKDIEEIQRKMKEEDEDDQEDD